MENFYIYFFEAGTEECMKSREKEADQERKREKEKWIESWVESDILTLNKAGGLRKTDTPKST